MTSRRISDRIRETKGSEASHSRNLKRRCRCEEQLAVVRQQKMSPRIDTHRHDRAMMVLMKGEKKEKTKERTSQKEFSSAGGKGERKIQRDDYK